MDLSQMKSKLASLTKPKTTYEKVDYSKIYWKPTVGKHQIRILDSKFDKNNPFKEFYLHYGIAKFPIMALSNWGEQDPIIQFCAKLRKSQEKEDWQLAKKLEPKMRVVVPVIVRGEEALGVRLWEFGTLNYKELLAIADDEDYGDFTDINEGRDFTVEGVSEVAMGRTYVKTSIRIKPKTSPLSDDPQLVEKWLNEQPDIMSVYKKMTFDEIKNILMNYLEPEKDENEEHNEVESEETLEHNEVESKSKNDLQLDKVKQQPTDKFDELFK